MVDQRLADAALEAVELRLDDAEANLSEALRCGDPRRRDAASTFMLRNVQRAAKRGYAVAASAASLEMNINTPPTHYTVVWGKPDEADRELGPGEFRRDGRILSVPDYGVERLAGEVAVSVPIPIRVKITQRDINTKGRQAAAESAVTAAWIERNSRQIEA